jgi:hypothetical protein
MRLNLPREFYIPKNAIQVPPPQGVEAVGYVYQMTPGGEKFGGLLFGGKRAKPDWHYIFKTEAQARTRLDEGFKGIAAGAAAKAKWAAERQAEKCLTVADVYAKAIKRGSISAAETAICLRAQLAVKFPGVKFSVRSDNFSMGCSVDVYWTDGPSSKAVDAVAHNYSFAGFDGMIDMKYSVERWLAPDGSMSLAHSTGTEGSKGSDPEAIGDPHQPQVVLVKNGAHWVHAHRELSIGLKRRVAEKIAKSYDLTLPADDNELERYFNTTRVGDYIYLSELVWRAANDELRACDAILD